MSLSIDQATDQIKQAGIVAIVRGDYTLDHLLGVCETLRTAGIRVLEVTLNSGGALAAIAALRERHGDGMLIGAGTVRTVDQADQAIDAGAQFLVAPCFDAATVDRASQRGVLHLPGVFTPTEAQTAFVAGCRTLKLFPSDVVGPAYLKALRAPLNDVAFIPTGGISADNLGAYVRAGAVAVGVGSTLIGGSDQALDDLAQRAHALRRALDEARHG